MKQRYVSTLVTISTVVAMEIAECLQGQGKKLKSSSVVWENPVSFCHWPLLQTFCEFQYDFRYI